MKTLAVDDVDRYYAGRDPRQTHFSFYSETDPSANSLDPDKQQPGQGNKFVEPDSKIAA